MTQPVKNDSAIRSQRLYTCPAPGCTNLYDPFAKAPRPVAGCSPACEVQAKRNAGTTVIELDTVPQKAVS